jgi:type IV pilus assembly protein PilF
MKVFLRMLGCGLIFVLGMAVSPAFAQYDAADFEQSGQAGNSGGGSVSDPRSRAKIHTELGALYFQAGNPAAALEHLALALEIDSRFHQANSVRGLVYASLREFAKAEADFARALSRAPDDPEVNNNYGWFLCETGKEVQSIAYFLKALKDPLYETPDRAYANAGSCALKAGDLDKAQGYLLQAIRLSRDGAVSARLALAKIFYRRGVFSESRVYLGDVLRLMEPPTAEALWLGLRLERKLGNTGAEGGFAAQLRSRYPTSNEYQEFLKGNFE